MIMNNYTSTASKHFLPKALTTFAGISITHQTNKCTERMDAARTSPFSSQIKKKLMNSVKFPNSSVKDSPQIFKFQHIHSETNQQRKHSMLTLKGPAYLSVSKAGMCGAGQR